MTETIGRNGRGQVSSVVAQVGTSTLLELTDAHEATTNNGNLKSQTIQPLGRKQTFTYDGKNQLESAVEQPVGGGAVSWSQTFGYDDFGNRWVAGFTGSLPGGGPRPNGPAWYQIPVGQSTVINNRVKDESYDAAGNQLSLGGLTGAYDGENRLKSAVPGVSFSYDAFGRRVGMAANGKTTVFVYDALGRLTAEYVAGQTAGTVKQYVVQDQLGSTRLVTDAVGGVVRRSDYLPYGEEIPGAVGGRTLTGYGVDGGVRQGFTGQARDVETGLDYFGARYYSGALGRFSSLDVPLFDQSPSDPMSWNLFAYVRNNPLRYIDPTGRGCVATQGAHSSTGIPLWTNTSDPRVPGPSCEEIDRQDAQGTPSVTVVEVAPPSAMLLAVAQGAQAASPVTDPRFIAGFYGASIVGGTAYAAYGAYGGYAGLTALGLKYSALGTASGAASTAAQNANKFIVPLKHLANSAGRWAKFAQGVDPQRVIREALSSPNAQFLPNSENSGSFVVITNLGKTIGSKGETTVKVVVDWTGNIWTAYPKK